MKASQLINKLNSTVKKYGDLTIAGGYMADDTPLREVVLIDSEGCDVKDSKREPTEIFLTQ